jgi:hypothetical protein
MQKQNLEKINLAVMVIIGWFALLAQFYINITSGVTGVGELLIRYFSYFTIQTNLLVAICFTILLLNPQSRWGRFFSRQQTLSAITVYIVIVGLIYNTILRFLWEPHGLQKIVDELLHTLIPLAVLVYWFVFTAKDRLQWKDVFPWLIYPFTYIVYILVRGSISGFYPYPFINTQRLGLNKVLVNAVGIAVVFICVSLLLVALAKSLRKGWPEIV